MLATLGAACTLAMVVLGLCWRDALDYMTSVQFALAERGDATIVFANPVTTRTVREVGHLPGILEAEGYRAVAVQLRAGHHRYRTAVLGVPREGRSYESVPMVAPMTRPPKSSARIWMHFRCATGPPDRRRHSTLLARARTST